MATYPAPTHLIRPLSPITELTTPASARSISLPVVDKEYDYQDESPIGRGHDREVRDGDGDSVYSQGSSCTIVPNDLPNTQSVSPPHDEVPISPPPNIRPLPTPSGGLPPPPRSASTTRSANLPISPGLTYLEDTESASSSPIITDAQTHQVDPVPEREEEEADATSIASVTSAGIAGIGAHVRATAPGPRSRPSDINVTAQYKPADMTTRISASYHPSLVNIPVIPSPHGSPGSRPSSIRDSQQLKRPDPPIRVASAHPSLVNIPIVGSPAPSPRARPNSIHGSGQARQEPSLRIPSNHSLVNIPFLPSPTPTPLPEVPPAKKSPVSRRPSPLKTNSPTRSRPSSPKSRPSTLKKRPNSLHASRPGSWHITKPTESPDVTIKAKKSGKGKGKRSSVLIEEEGGGSSNDTHSNVSAGLRSRRTSRIPSILLSLFEPNSPKRSQTTSTVASPTSREGQSPRSPIEPHQEDDVPDEIKGDAPPLEVVRTSGTFGIQDDGSVHLLLDEPGPVTSSSATGRPQRSRRDSDNGTVKSAPLGPVLYMGNPDPRDSIDEGYSEERDSSEESKYQTPRSLTPFENENPTSPLESVLNSASPLDRSQVERRSVDGVHLLQVVPGRSDVSERAQSPSTRNSETTSRGSHAQDLREVTMIDHWTQTSPAPSFTASSLSKRPLPIPPSSVQPGSPGTSSVHHHDPRTRSSRFNERARPTSLPPPPMPSTTAYPQPYAPAPLSPTSDLPLLIASHLLSNHASALMRHSSGLAEGAEMMKRMADESMQWGAVLLNMASGQSTSGMPVPMPVPPKSWSTEVQPPTEPIHPPAGQRERQRKRSATTDQRPTHDTTSSASQTPLDPLYPSRPFPSRDYRAEDDRYTPIPPRMSSRRIRSYHNLYTEFYDEVDRHGRRGWEELHQAEEIWVKGMRDLRGLLDNEPDEGVRSSGREKMGDQSHNPVRDSTGESRHGQRYSTTEMNDFSANRQSVRSAQPDSVIRTDESFQSITNPLASPDLQTGTESSFRPQSFDLLTPLNPRPVHDDHGHDHDQYSTVRARDYSRQKQLLPFSPDPTVRQDMRTSTKTASTSSKGYGPEQFHPHPAVYPILNPQAYKQSVISTFDLNTEVPLFPHTVGRQSEKSNAGSLTPTGTGTGGRKLKKRSSALHLQLAPQIQTPLEGRERQPSTAGTTKSRSSGKGKKHWWSRKREGTGSTIDGYEQDWKGSLTTA